jgi:hypothetical protein
MGSQTCGKGVANERQVGGTRLIRDDNIRGDRGRINGGKKENNRPTTREVGRDF